MSFTPFGNLQNPHYQCVESYYDVRSGILQSDTILTGVGWVVPFPKRPGWVVSLGFGLTGETGPLLSRADFRPYGLVAARHTPYLLELKATVGEAVLTQRYWLGETDRLYASVSLTGASKAQPVLLARAWRPDGSVSVMTAASGDGSHSPRQSVQFTREDDSRYTTPPVTVMYDGDRPAVAGSLAELASALADPGSGSTDSASNERFAGSILPGWTATVVAALGETAAPVELDEPPTGIAVYGVRAFDAAASFEHAVPRLTGAFDPAVKHGFHYDFETTRLCTLPATGIFNGPWPTWMSSMPRMVLAEGSMDLARLGYAEPKTALAGVRTMLSDTPGDNVPCVFASGGYNMVAADGTTCGTSPAWCIPFFHIYDLFLRMPDRKWVADIYPQLAKLIDYWLRERTDDAGWLTYKCTWEAGEDNNPRIDPLATGDNVISNYVRPVELQAAMSHAGRVMAALASYLANPEDETHYATLADEYRERVQQLWDGSEGRFRDWDKTSDAFVSVAGKENYWGADFTRQSPLSLVATLFDTATEEQKRTMRAEIERFFRSPFTVWPSWSTFVLEAARSCGMDEFRGEMAFEIARRVYAGTDRRSIGEFERPLPGAAPEYWPHDWNEFGGNDAYAWGAQSATFLIRHVLGIIAVEGDGLGLELAPSIPEILLAFGDEYGIENLAHRGQRIGVHYRFIGGANLECSLRLEQPRAVTLRLPDREAETRDARPEHVITIMNCTRVRVE